MLKRIVSTLLIAVMLVVLPLTAGCGDDITTEHHRETGPQVVEQHEVVE